VADLIVPTGTVLTIDQAHPLAPRYGLFRMEANATIVASVDLVIKADRAEFEANCVIDARGALGVQGSNGPDPIGGNGASGGDGGAGAAGTAGYNVMIETALTRVGGLSIASDGGMGGPGGRGGNGGVGSAIGGRGGQGGPGGPGGDAGQISLAWMRAAPGLPTAPGVPPDGHIYRSDGGPGGPGGTGGYGGVASSPFGKSGTAGPNGPGGANGKSLTPEVAWRVDIAKLLWAQAQDIGPPPRSGHGLAFDPARAKLVMFGGEAEGKTLGDTWEWDGQLWTQVADTGPAPRAYHGMAYDPIGANMLVFGGASKLAGADGNGQYLSDTWGWDGEVWTQLADTGPSARQAPAMAADPVRQRVTLFSGGQIGGQGNQAISDTWEWDGAAWIQVADTGPTGRLSAKLAYDQEASVLVLFGGLGSSQRQPTPGPGTVSSGGKWLTRVRVPALITP
jgi:hypothetical protein